MDSPVMEDHIKFEAEEAKEMTDQVWEEVVIEETVSIPTWKQDLEDEDSDSFANDVEIVSESEGVHGVKTEYEQVADDEMIAATTEEEDPLSIFTSVATISESSLVPEVINVTAGKELSTTSILTNPTIISNSSPIKRIGGAVKSTPIKIMPNVSATTETSSYPIVTSVKSLAPRPLKKIVNLHQLRLLPKGSIINIGNKRMKLVSYTGDKKTITGKVLSMTGNDNKVITGKVLGSPNKVVQMGSPNKIVQMGSPNKIVQMGSPNNKVLPKVAKVVTVQNSNISTAAANMVNKVVPAKVVSVPSNRLKPIAPKDKEVTIYITGLAGDKVQVRDSTDLPVEQQTEEYLDGWRYDLSSNLAGENWIPDTEVSDGHFLLDGNKMSDTGSFTCETCDRQFTQLKYLLNHQQTHIVTEPVVCDFCGKQFKRRYDLLRHKRRAHADSTIYECDVCHKTFADLAVANRHRLTHTEDFKYCCEVCSRPFRFVQDLKRHRSIHFDEKPFDCEICGKKFKHKSNLKTHQSTHYSEKPFSCTLCDKRFHQKGNLKTHLIVHTGEMPFVCNLCEKRFHTRSGLLNHSYSHSDEKPFQCDVCDKTFNWKSGLLTHQQTHRRLSVEPEIIQEEVEVIEIGPIPVDN